MLGSTQLPWHWGFSDGASLEIPGGEQSWEGPGRKEVADVCPMQQSVEP